MPIDQRVTDQSKIDQSKTDQTKIDRTKTGQTKINEWMPDYQVSARYSIVVNASPQQTYAALLRANFAGLPIVRGLMRLRGYRLAGNNSGTSAETQPGRRFGFFLELAVIPCQEVVLGVVGRFWRPDGGIVRDLTPPEFRDFRRSGYARAVWSFSLSPTETGTRLGTETRVQTFGRPATVKFRPYWLVVGPFSGIIRKAMLREIKRLAEQPAA